MKRMSLVVCSKALMAKFAPTMLQAMEGAS